MEIRSVKNEVRAEYPKINEISKKTLKKSIPTKWLKIGLTSWMLSVITRGQVLALAKQMINTEISGGVPVVTAGVVQMQTPMYVKVINLAAPIIGGLSLITFLASLISIIKTKRKMKKENKQEKINKKYKVLLIISIILLLASIIAKILVGCCL